MTSPNSTCLICDSENLHEFIEFSSLPRVTSDCKPFAAGGRLILCMKCGAVQKPIDDTWLAEIDKIYHNYAPYFQSGGREQAVFDASCGIPALRSDVILDQLDKVRPFPADGTLIDVGCGNGVLLKAFSAKRPNWRLFGYELSDLHKNELAAIPGFEELYTGELNAIPENFELITMMHALEHIIDPYQAVCDLKTKLAPDGTLFIEVPNAAVTPFDLLIADHVSHFSSQHLAMILSRAGMSVPVVAENWVTKELSAVATCNGRSFSLPPAPEPQAKLKQVKSQLNWLKAVMEGAQLQAEKSDRFGIFGTSVAAMWMVGFLGDAVDFFVDEDPSRESTTLLGRPVYNPSQIPSGSHIYTTLIPSVARAVAERLGRPDFEFHLTPEQEI